MTNEHADMLAEKIIGTIAGMNSPLFLEFRDHKNYPVILRVSAIETMVRVIPEAGKNYMIRTTLGQFIEVTEAVGWWIAERLAPETDHERNVD